MKQLWQLHKQGIESVYNADLFDVKDWQSACQAFPGLDEDNEAAGQEFCGQPIQDGFFGLYKAAPQLKDSPGKLAPLSDLIKRGQETPDYARLRESTVGKQIAAAMGAKHFIEQVLKNLPDEVKEKAQEAEQAQAQADQINDKAESLESLAKMLSQIEDEDAQDQAQELAEQAQQVQAQAQDAQAQADQAMGDYQEAADGNQAQIANILNQAAAQAQDKADEAQSLATAFSLAAGGDPQHLDPETSRMAMQALKNNPNLKDLADLLGYAKRMVRGEWRQAAKGNRNMTGYTAHELQPNRMASSELLAMNSPVQALRTDFMRRVAESSVIHRHYDGEEKQGQGPIVLVRDESGSMAGSQHSMAVAMEWALLEIARKDNRDFYSIPFSGSGQYQVWQAPKKGQADPQGLLNHLSHFYGGGTDPYPPVNEALNIIKAQDLEADVLIITDGSFDTPSPRFMERIGKLQKTKIVTVTIGGWGDRVAGQFSDKVVNVRNLVTDRDKLRDAVREIV